MYAHSCNTHQVDALPADVAADFRRILEAMGHARYNHDDGGGYDLAFDDEDDDGPWIFTSEHATLFAVTAADAEAIATELAAECPQ